PLRTLGWIIAGVVLIGLFFLFPRAFAFAELAARELRYLWWLVLLLVFGLWLAFSFGKRKD
ncbi:MAG TPA: hypothetical protein VG672_28850, partial [Bryobacteraceae bacterium]|nr:hypothetical protein [Bryobacteraceae bacterium]